MPYGGILPVSIPKHLHATSSCVVNVKYQQKDAFRNGLVGNDDCDQFTHLLILQEYFCIVSDVLLLQADTYDMGLLEFCWCLGSC